jgi:hypothetical protein
VAAGDPDSRGPSWPNESASALIEDRRWVDLAAGSVEVPFDRVAHSLDPGSIAIDSLTDPGGVLLDRCRPPIAPDADLDDLLAAQLGAPVTLTVDGEETAGILRAAGPLVALETPTGLRLVRRSAVTELAVAPSATPDSADLLRCRLRVRHAGRHLLQLVYAARGLGFHVDYDVEARLGAAGAGRARVTPRFTLDNRAGLRGAVRLLLSSGAIGSDGESPVPVWSGAVELAPGEVALVARPEAVPARGAAAGWLPVRLEYVYRGALPDPSTSPSDPYWGSSGSTEVVAQLVLGGDRAAALPPGRVLATIAVSDADGAAREPRRIATALRRRADAGTDPVRLDLWPVSELFGQRRVTPLQTTDHGLVERLELSVTNGGPRPAVVWIVEPLARPGVAIVHRSHPEPAAVEPHEIRFRLEVAPRHTGRAAFDVEYRW